MIEEGTVGAGMTREQVLMALGYPPAHRTPRLDAPVWMYCADREDTFEVYFDGDRVSRVNRQEKGHDAADDGGPASRMPRTIRIMVATLAWMACGSWLASAAHAEPTGSLPPSEETAKARLNGSPRHGELATVDLPGAPLRVWAVYPERKDRAPVVVVIHEIFGLTDWIRAVADQLAAEGFIALAPDLLSGKGPNGGGTDAYASRDDVTKAVSSLPRDEVIARLNAVRAYGLARPGASTRTATIGFCWGGSISFAYAVAQPGLNAAVVYYGTAPDDLSTLASVKAPVLGLYGGNDARVDATIPATEARMKALGRTYEPHVFDGAGHGFLRAQAGQDGANLRATERAWPITIAFLRRHTE